MIRQTILTAVATAVVFGGPVSQATAQYAVRGGPLPPQRGPSYYYGAYAPSFYNGPLPGGFAGPGAGASFVPNYAAYPQLNNNGGFVTIQPPQVVYYPQPAMIQQPQRPVTEPMPPTTVPTPPRSPGSPGPSGSLSAAEPTTPAPPAPPPSTTTGIAHFTVTVPADAKLWVNDVETRQTGERRRFHTPENLDSGRSYEYTFRAQWAEAGQTVTRDRKVQFKTGDDVTVDFTQTPGR